MRAVIVGGSIGGLTTGLLLRDLGCDVDIFERSPAPLEGRGAGIVLHPATVRYLTERVGTVIEEISTSASWLRYLDQRGGVASELPCNYRFLSYNSLYQRLLECFPGSRYHLGEECVRVENDANAACARFATGRVERAELVVCADGINSIGRRLLQPDVQPCCAEYVAWRGTVDEADLSAGLFSELSTAMVYHVLASGGHMLTYPIPTCKLALVSQRGFGRGA
jgi:2,6-dihydroxypyridine 3-monooxygenase